MMGRDDSRARKAAKALLPSSSELTSARTIAAVDCRRQAPDPERVGSQVAAADSQSESRNDLRASDSDVQRRTTTTPAARFYHLCIQRSLGGVLQHKHLKAAENRFVRLPGVRSLAIQFNSATYCGSSAVLDQAKLLPVSPVSQRH